MKSALRTAAIAATAALALSACSSAAPEGEAGPSSEAASTLAVNWGGFPDSWAPGADMEPGYMRVPYENLVEVMSSGEVVPALAESWEQTDTDLTLKLREGVTFHDGTEFDAEAVKANLESVQNSPGPYSGTLAAVSAIEVVDPLTVKLNLASPNPSILTSLSTVAAPIASPASLADGTAATHPVGTGPWAYSPDDSSEGTRMTFQRFKDYWGDEVGFDTIELYAISDDNAVAAALKSGELDISDTEPESLSGFEGTSIETLGYPAVRNNLTFFDRGPGGLFEDLEVRQGLCYALDTEVMVDLEPDRTSATGHFSEGDIGYSGAEGYSHDLDRARELFSKAGNPAIAAEMIAAPFNERQITVYADQMGQLDGVTVGVQSAAPPQWASEWNSGRFPLGVGSHNELTPFDWYQAWFAADAPANPSGVESAALKAAADAAIAAGNSDDAAGLWAEVTRIISDEALSCGHMIGEELIAWNTDRVQNVAAPSQPWELNLVNYRDLTPAGS